MLAGLARKRDFYAGGAVTLLGVATVSIARNYDLGSLRHMGPGYFPLVLGVILIGLGVLITAAAAVSEPHQDERPLPSRLEWRAWGLVVLGPALFVAIGPHLGLAPATFACVFISAMADRSNSWKESALLALGVAIFGSILFAYFLKVPFPILQWSGL